MALTRPSAAQINTTTLDITDPLFRINKGQSGANDKDIGLVLERGSDTNVAFIWDESADQFVLINTTETGTTSGNVTISSYADLQVGTINTSSLEIGGTAVTSTAAELNILDGVTATATEINYLDGVTSAIQTQIDNISSSFTLAADSGVSDTFTTGETLTFTGGTGIDTTVSDNTITYAIDSTVATLTGSQTLTNKTLTSPVISTISNTGTLTLPTTTGTIALTSDIPTAVSELTNDSGYSTTTGTVTSVTGTGTVNGLTLSGTVTSSGSLTLGGTFSATVSEISDLTATAAELNILDGVTATTAELNILDGVTATATEINRLDGIGSAAAGISDTQTLTNKTLTSPVVTTDIRLNAQAELEFFDSDSSHYVSFRAPATVASSVTWTLPASDGTADQVLATNGAGTLSWADAGAGGGSGSSYPNSTFQTVPGTDGNFDLSYNVAQTTQETPFEASGTDAFGVNLGSVFDSMDPVGTLDSLDYGDGEAYVGA